MKQDRREKIASLVDKLQEASGWESDGFKQLVDLLFEDAKHKLVSSDGDDMLRLQGEARAFERLSDRLKYLSPTRRGE